MLLFRSLVLLGCLLLATPGTALAMWEESTEFIYANSQQNSSLLRSPSFEDLRDLEKRVEKKKEPRKIIFDASDRQRFVGALWLLESVVKENKAEANDPLHASPQPREVLGHSGHTTVSRYSRGDVPQTPPQQNMSSFIKRRDEFWADFKAKEQKTTAPVVSEFSPLSSKVAPSLQPPSPFVASGPLRSSLPTPGPQAQDIVSGINAATKGTETKPLTLYRTDKSLSSYILRDVTMSADELQAGVSRAYSAWRAELASLTFVTMARYPLRANRGIK